MTTIQIQSLCKRFGATYALNDINLEIKPSERFFLLGPSGCGKTTLLRLIAGFYSADSGALLFDGKDVSSVPAHLRDTAMVFQNYALWPHMTVAGNVRFGLEMHNVPEPERTKRTLESLELVQIAKYADRFPHQLSGGQQQRVALARALVLRPKVILFDEPLSNLDTKLRIEMRAEIRRLHKDLGCSMIYVTHDQGEALSLADRIAILKEGKLIQVGSPAEIYQSPSDTFVANFIGEANILNAERHGNTLLVAGTQIDASKSLDTFGGNPKICIRPEALKISSDTSAQTPNTFRAKIEEIEYLGDTTRLYTRISDQLTLTSTVSSIEYSALEKGANIFLKVDPSQVIVLNS